VLYHIIFPKTSVSYDSLKHLFGPVKLFFKVFSESEAAVGILGALRSGGQCRLVWLVVDKAGG